MTAGSARPPTAPRAPPGRWRGSTSPLPVTAPLAAGDPVVAADLGVRGTIAEVVGDEATVLGRGGLRIRVPLDRLRPDRDGATRIEPAEPAVTVRAMIQNDLPDEIDLRGRTARRRGRRCATSSTRRRSRAGSRCG